MVKKRIGSPIHNVYLYNFAVGKDAHGQPIIAAVLNGRPARLVVLNLETHKQIMSAPLPGAQGAMRLTIADDGQIYVGTFDNGTVYCCDPVKESVTEIGCFGDSFLYGLAVTDNEIFVGGFPNCSVAVVDRQSHKLQEQFVVDKTQRYLRCIKKMGSMLYLGVGVLPRFYAFDLKTRELTAFFLGDMENYSGSVVKIEMFGDYCVALVDQQNKVVLINPKAPEHKHILDGYSQFAVHNDNLYLFNSHGTYVYNSETASVGLLTRGFSHRQREIVAEKIEGSDVFLTLSAAGVLSIYNLNRGSVSDVDLNLPGQDTIIQCLFASPAGDLYMGGYQSGGLSVFNPQSGETREYKGIGQIEGMCFAGDNVYAGIYPGAHIQALTVPLKGEGKVEPELLVTIGEGQDRPFAITSDGTRLFIGTVPVPGELGGALTVYDLEAKTHSTSRNLIPGQSIISLTYRDGLLYGGTSIWGGMGKVPETADARVFIWSVEDNSLVKEFVPFPGEKAICALAFDGDGRLWGITRTIVFELNPKTGEVLQSRAIEEPDWELGHLWREGTLRFDSQGEMYALIRSSVYKITKEGLHAEKLADDVVLMEVTGGKLYTAVGYDLFEQDLDV